MPSINIVQTPQKILIANIENKVCLGCHQFSLDILSNAVINDVRQVSANQLVEASRLTDYKLKDDEIAVYPLPHHHGLDYKISVTVRHKCNSDTCYNFEPIIENILYEI